MNAVLNWNAPIAANGRGADEVGASMAKRISDERREQLSRQLHVLAQQFVLDEQGEPIEEDWRSVPEYVILAALAEAIKHNEISKLGRVLSECRKYGEASSKSRSPMFLPRKQPPQAYRDAVEQLHQRLHGDARTVVGVHIKPSPRMHPADLVGLQNEDGTPRAGHAEGPLSEVLEAIDPKLTIDRRRWFDSLVADLHWDERLQKYDMRHHNWSAEHVIDLGLRASGVSEEQLERIKRTNYRVVRKKRKK